MDKFTKEIGFKVKNMVMVLGKVLQEIAMKVNG